MAIDGRPDSCPVPFASKILNGDLNRILRKRVLRYRAVRPERRN